MRKLTLAIGGNGFSNSMTMCLKIKDTVFEYKLQEDKSYRPYAAVFLNKRQARELMNTLQFFINYIPPQEIT